MPMIPLGLKETKEIDFRDPFKDFILEHYSEDASQYEDAIADFMDTRQAIRTPLRDLSGISLLFRYYNQLYFVERRFFPPDRSLGIYFEWFDSLTGVPSCQRTVAFEKACVLFNMGAIYTQIGAKQDRSTAKGLDAAVDSFLRAAGTFRYIHENFTNAPSMDLRPEMLEMLVQLMLVSVFLCFCELKVKYVGITGSNKYNSTKIKHGLNINWFLNSLKIRKKNLHSFSIFLILVVTADHITVHIARKRNVVGLQFLQEIFKGIHFHLLTNNCRISLVDKD